MLYTRIQLYFTISAQFLHVLRNYITMLQKVKYDWNIMTWKKMKYDWMSVYKFVYTVNA